MRPGYGPRRKAAFGGRIRPPFGGGPDYLLNYADGTHSRASAATWELLPTSIPEYGSGVARILSGGDYATEGARTNAIDGDSSILDSASWTLLASATLASDAVASLFGGESADALSFVASADSGNGTDLLGTNDGETVTASAIAWTTSGTKDFRLRVIGRDAVVNSSPDLTATTTPQKFTYTIGLGTGATQPEMRIVNEAGGGAGTIVVDHVQCEVGAFASSPIRKADGAAATRAPDDMVIPQASVDPRLWTDTWTTTLTMGHGDSELATWGQVFASGVAGSNCFLVSSTNFISFYMNNVAHVIALASGYSAGDEITIEANVTTGAYTVTTPIQVVSGTHGTPVAWPVGDLSVSRTAWPFFGTIGRPVAV